jgi:hypothetical protein
MPPGYGHDQNWVLDSTAERVEPSIAAPLDREPRRVSDMSTVARGG